MKEKSYSDYMDEITAEELYTGLLGHGLFADKLPAFLSSKGFCGRLLLPVIVQLSLIS